MKRKLKTTNQIIGIIILICNFTVCEGHTQEFKIDPSYFPLVENSTYYYRGFFNGKESVDGIKVRKTVLSGNCTGYYFEDLDGNSNSIIKSNMFGLGIYLRGIDGLYTVEAFWKNDIGKVHCIQKQKILPNSINLETKIEYLGKQSNPKYLLTVEGLENIEVPAGKFKDCLKIRILTKWDSNEEYVEYVWLSRDVGLVKWRRGTGKVEELLNFNLLSN
ncbi:MAG: hypothetical protein P8L23_00755 [Flavobacteriales bacterium]|nr:hypothetical protein [Flavobacteriales bacterium]